MDEPMDISMCDDVSPSDVSMAEAFTPRKPEPKKSSINITITSNQQILNNNRINTDEEKISTEILLNTTDNSLSLTHDFKTPQTSFIISDNTNKVTEDCPKQNDLSLVDNADNRNSSNVLNITIETKDKSSSNNLQVVNIEDNATPNQLNVTFEGSPSNASNNTDEESPKVLNTTFEGNTLGKAFESIMEGLGLPTVDSSSDTVNTTFEESTSAKSAGISPLPNLNTTFDGKASVPVLNTPSSVATLNTTFDGKSAISSLNTTFDGKSPVPALNTTFDGKSPVPTLNTTLDGKSPLPSLNTTFDGKSSVPALNTPFDGKSPVAAINTFDGKSPIPNLDTTFAGKTPVPALNTTLNGKSPVPTLDTTFDGKSSIPNLNTTFDGISPVPAVNTTFEGKSPVPTLNTTIDGKSPLPSLNTTFDGKSAIPSLNTTLDGKSPVPALNTTFDGKSPVPISNTTLDGKSSLPHLNTTFDGKSSVPALNTPFDGKSPIAALNTTFDGKSPIPNLDTTFTGKTTVPALNTTFNGKSPVPTLDITFDGKSPIPNLNTTFDVKSPVPTLNTAFDGKSSFAALNTTFEGQSPIPNLNTTFARKSPVPASNSTFEGKAPVPNLNTTFDVNSPIPNLNATFDVKSPVPALSTTFEGKSPIPTLNTAFDGKSPILNTTFDVKSPVPALSTTFEVKSTVPTLNTASDGKSPIPNLNTTFDVKSPVPTLNTKLEGKSPVPTLNTTFDGKSPIPTLNSTFDVKSPVPTLNTTFEGKSPVPTTVLSLGNDQTPSNDLNITTDKPKVISLLDSTFQMDSVEGTASNTGIMDQNNLQPTVELESKVDEEKCLDLKIESAQTKEDSKIQLESLEKSNQGLPTANGFDNILNPTTPYNDHNVIMDKAKDKSLLDTKVLKENVLGQIPSNDKPKVESLLDQTFQTDIVDGNKMEPRVESLLDSTIQKEAVTAKALDSSLGVQNNFDPTLNISTGSNQLFFNLTDTSRLNSTVISSENVADDLKLAGKGSSRRSVLPGDVTFSLLDITVTCNADEGNVIRDKVVESDVLDEILEVKCRDDEIDSSEEDKLSKTIESIVEQADKAINESFNSSLTEEAAIKEDRVPLKNLEDNSLEQCKGKKEDVKVVEIVVSDNKSCEDKENQQSDKLFGDPKALIDAKQYDFSIFNSPVRGVKGPRNSILRLFDPLSQPTNKVRESQEPAISEDTVVEDTVVEDKESDLVKSLKEALDVSDDHDHEEFVNQLPNTIKTYKSKMDEALEQKMQSEQELNTLKLELNQLQQERTTLELELHQKDEIILKTQGEAQKRENQYKHEIKQLYDKLNNINEQNNNEEVKSLREENAALLDRESQLNEKFNKLVHKENSFQKIMLDYESTLSRKFTEFEKLKAEHDTAKKHLATLEMSFSDLHTKYERSKDIIAGYKNNEEALTRNLEGANQLAHKNEERYESLKAHAKAQIEKSNKELALMKEKHTVEVNKLSTIIRRLEIKNGSIQQALDQKTKECAALAALCDEMTGAH